MISKIDFKNMSKSLDLIVDAESRIRLLSERVKFTSSLRDDDLLCFVIEEIENTINIIDKKLDECLPEHVELIDPLSNVVKE